MNETKISLMQSSAARENFRDVLTRVEHKAERITFTRHGAPIAVIVPMEWYERAAALISAADVETIDRAFGNRT